MEIKGRIIHILEEQSGVSKISGKEWRSQDYVLEETDTPYPRKICFNIFGENIDKFKIQMGEDLIVSINIESREYNERWYTSVRAWKVERAADVAAAPAGGVDPLAAAPKMDDPLLGGGADDLPF